MNKLKKILYYLLIYPYRLLVRKERVVQIDDILVHVPPSVFHPTIFFSTQFLKKHLENEDLVHKKVLDLGAGTGFLSIFMAKKGAEVWASDINEVACQTVEKNAIQNKVLVQVIHSDLFNNFPQIQFDLIVINPPYYAKNPKNDTEKAFFCGENFEYFQQLFEQLPHFLTTNGKAIMVLSEDCAIEKISQLAVSQGFIWNKIKENRIKTEMNYLFEIRN